MLRTRCSRVALAFLDSRAQRKTVVVAIFACAALLAFSRVQDFDFFWHLANGRAMWLDRQVVDREMFSYTRPGVPFSNHGWAAEVILYLVFAAGGPLGIVLFKTALVLLMGWLVYRTARSVGAAPVAAAVLMLLAIFGGLERYRERPELFSLVLFALTGYVLTGVSVGKLARSRLYALPLVLTIWDLLHGAVYGFLYLGAFIAGEAAKRWLGRRGHRPPEVHRSLLTDLLLVLAASVALSLASPYGIRKYDFFVEYVGANPMVGRIAEWGSSPFTLYPIFWALLVGFVALAIRFGRRGDLTRTLVGIAFFALAVRYRRAIPFAMLGAVPAAATFIASASRSVPRRVASGLGVGAAAALVAWTVFLKFLAGDNPYAFGYEVNGLLLPVGSTRYVAQSALRGNMYNPGHFGGYLAYYLYPERRIFLYNHHVVFKDLPSAVEDPRVLDQYDVQYAVLERQWGASSAYPAVFPPDRWALVFWDDASRVLVRRFPGNTAFLEANALRYFSPEVLGALERYASDPGALERYESDPAIALALAHEIASCLRFYRNGLAADYLAYLFLRYESAVRADAALADVEGVLGANPSSAYLWYAAGRFHLRSGESELAKRALARASALDPQLVSRLERSMR
jgi:tetratricopeptide (TPR) repeat protein